MGIKVQTADRQPALVYENVHLEKLEIVQSRPVTEPPYPKYSLLITYRLYAIGDDGTRYYSGRPRVVQIEDYVPKAMHAMEQGDPRLIQALGAIEQALADILDESGTHGKTSVI
jgi:hypothetical protein